MIVKLLTEHHLEFLSLTGGCGGSSESTLVKTSNCWKSQSTAHISFFQISGIVQFNKDVLNTSVRTGAMLLKVLFVSDKRF